MMVRMICSCGATMEHADNPTLTVSIEAGKWREDHAACASRMEPQLPCPHSRPSWKQCPHCLGVNDAAKEG